MLYDCIIGILPCLYYIFQLWLVFLLSYVAHIFILATQQLDEMVRTRQTPRKSVVSRPGETHSFTMPSSSRTSASVSSFT